MSDSLDDLAAFLLHHTYDDGVSDPDRLQLFALVMAYQEGDEPATVEAQMRTAAARFASSPDYRREWTT